MEKSYLKGLYVKRNPKAPDFVVGSISIKREDLIEELRTFDDEYIDLDILKSKTDDGIYAKINTWKPNKEANVVDIPKEGKKDDGIPY